MVKFKDFSRPLSVFQVLFKANLIFKDFSRQSCIFKYFSSLSQPWRITLLCQYRKTCVKRPHSKIQKIGFQDQLSLNAGQKYCRMLQEEHSAILSTIIKLPIVIKIFVLSILVVDFDSLPKNRTLIIPIQ